MREVFLNVAMYQEIRVKTHYCIELFGKNPNGEGGVEDILF